MDDEHLVGAAEGGVAHHICEFCRVVGCQQEGDLEAGRSSATSGGEDSYRRPHCFGTGAVPPLLMGFAGAGHGQGHDMDRAPGEPQTLFADQITVGGDSHLAAGGRSILRHFFESRVQERFSPALKTKVMHEPEFRTQPLPQVEIEVALLPPIGQDGSRTTGTVTGAA